MSDFFFCLSAFISMLLLLSVPLTLTRFVEPDPSHTLEERVVHWYFAQLDNNGNHDINKKELKPFKRYLKKKAKPKKCARKFTDYCDLNKDRAISLQELKGCLGISKEGKRKMKAGINMSERKQDGWEWIGRVMILVWISSQLYRILSHSATTLIPFDPQNSSSRFNSFFNFMKNEISTEMS